MPQDFQLVTKPAVMPVSAHAWNKDRTQLAYSPNSEVVLIVEFKAGGFNLLHTLKEHSQNVTSIDWAPNTNCIVTCGQDRNAYVWKLEDGTWKPTLVILRINRAATCVKWSPKEDKFAVGSGSRLISICYFEEANDWWISKHIKKPIRSTVLSVDWHPNNVLVAAGSSDFKARVFSAMVKGVDSKVTTTTWGDSLAFGNALGEFSTGAAGGGWVHSVAFSSSGDQLAFAAHDSSITVVDSTQNMKVFRLSVSLLPFRCLLWITPKSIVAAGHDYVPVLFSFDGSAVTQQGKMDVPEKKAKGPSSAMDKFKTLDKKGTTDEESVNTAIDSVHQNAIIEMSVFAGKPGAVTSFCSGGVDGKIVIWDIAEIKSTTGLNIL